MRTRELNESDASDYYELRLEALLTNPAAFITTYEQEKQKTNPIEQTKERLNSNDSHTFGVFIEEQLSGVVTLVKETHPKFIHKGSVVAMYVAPGYRGSGAAQQLLRELINFSRAINIELLHLSVVTENKAAKNLYLKMGFEVYGFERHAIKLSNHYLNEEHMELFLNE